MHAFDTVCPAQTCLLMIPMWTVLPSQDPFKVSNSKVQSSNVVRPLKLKIKAFDLLIFEILESGLWMFAIQSHAVSSCCLAGFSKKTTTKVKILGRISSEMKRIL